MIEREGDLVRVRGAITLAEVTRFREAGLQEIDSDGIKFDLSSVEDADSSALSLLLEWQRAANARGFRLSYTGLPQNLRSLAGVYGILELLALED
jgi:phospholipid transport system transporter-binding protein